MSEFRFPYSPAWDLGNPIDDPSQWQERDLLLEAHLNANHGVTIVTSTSRPTDGLYQGQLIYETDTGKTYQYDGSVWIEQMDDGAWDTYTPTVGGAGWAIGNGAIAGFYKKIGRLVVFKIGITWGNTTTFGAGVLTITLPPPNLSGGSAQALGRFVDASAGQGYPAGWLPNTATTLAVICYAAGGAYLTEAFVNNGVPFLWAVNDTIELTGFYQSTT